MEILMLVLLYYLSQNPDFSESVKPLMAQIKDSEQMLNFLKDLSKFTQTFSALKTEPPPSAKKEPSPKEKCEEKENPQSPTKGIADAFIQNILDSYLKKT
jgi:hypothetical protein